VLVAGPNLTIDRTLSGAALRPGEVLRFSAEAGPGGKGLNVARGAQALGAPAVLVAFLPGRTGAAVGDLIGDEEIALRGVPCGGEVRSTTVVLEPDGRSTVLNERGPEIGQEDWERFEDVVRAALAGHRVVVCTGSLPPGAPAGGYARLTALAREHGVSAIVDGAGPVVAAALPAAPDLVTPNLAEAEAALGAGDGSEPVDVPPDARPRAEAAAAALRTGGARAALVTAAAAGAALATPGGVAWLPAPAVRVRNPIGAGDALVAGLAAALEGGAPLLQAARAGIAAGAACVEDPRAGRLDPVRAAELLERAG
jgi:1-phosphofructokinase family hexose kinase